MDRDTANDRRFDHKQNATIARQENRFWDALYEEAMAFHLSFQGINRPQDGGAVNAQMAFGHTLVLLKLSPPMRKEITAAIVKWSQESGMEEELQAILEGYKS